MRSPDGEVQHPETTLTHAMGYLAEATDSDLGAGCTRLSSQRWTAHKASGRKDHRAQLVHSCRINSRATGWQ